MPLDVRGLCPLIQVFDMPTSLAFYRDVLGFTVVASAPPASDARGDEFGWVLLQHGSAELMLNTAYDPEEERPPAVPPERGIWHFDTMLFIGSPDVDAVYAHLRTNGVAVDPPKVAPYGMKQLMLRDPDGYGVCFQWKADPRDHAE